MADERLAYAAAGTVRWWNLFPARGPIRSACLQTGACNGSPRRGKTIARKFQSRERTLLRRCARRRGRNRSRRDRRLHSGRRRISNSRTVRRTRGRIWSCTKVSAAGGAQSLNAISCAKSGHRFGATRLGDGFADLTKNGGGRNARSHRRRISSVFGR